MRAVPEARTSVGLSLGKVITYVVLVALTFVFIGPILFILLNSFKNKLFINNDPFQWPSGNMFAGIANYVTGLSKEGFGWAIGLSFFITIAAVFLIVFCCAMTGYFVTRINTWWTTALYFLFVFSMVIPFQMVMYPTLQLANNLHLNNPVGILVLYLGFGAGLSVFIFSGFVKSIPLEIEEAAMIDGCNPLQTYFQIVWPILRPVSITVAILNAMWVWNDYLLPYLVLGIRNSKYRTIPVVIQEFVGSRGDVDYGAMMAMLVLAILPIIAFYMAAQKYIIEGVVAGSVKG